MKIKYACIATAIALATSSNALANVEYVLRAGDPLTSQQWHLQNTGQTAFSERGGKVGEDMNLDLTHALGILGVGVTAAVIDGGVQLNHPDLINNVKPGSWDFLTNSANLKPKDANDTHGTAVAGIIAASAYNGIGGRGVAPLAGIVGFNLLKKWNEANWLQSHGLYSDGFNRASFDFPRVFNQSYGGARTSPQRYNYEITPWLKRNDDAQEEITRHSHGGKGAIFVKSAGNSYQSQSITLKNYGRGRIYFDENNQGLPVQNSNLERMDATYWNLVTSAYNADGVKSSYSEVGSNVFVSAPGGQYGTTSPAIITTDLTGCDRGRNPAYGRNTLHGGHELDPTCDYNARMNGTSSAAPNVAGAIALIMSANPALNWRDVRHILAATARKIDAEHPGVSLSFNHKNGDSYGYDAIPTWQTNAAGYHFHTFYGFGAVDVDAAVNMARFYSTPLPPLEISVWNTIVANIAIPDGNITGVDSHYQQHEDITVEAVQIQLTAQHTSTRDVAVELISPSGTRSVLMTPRTGTIFGRSGFTETQMLSHNFYGESAKGTWTLRLIDTQGVDEKFTFNPSAKGEPNIRFTHRNNTEEGTLNSWNIRFIGHK
ncbi:S8 family serine peptidase [Pseudoalteromonas sp. MMG005]|uniref:S8 family serine peptidase n=1 Tax=Pseudoalteromonas sp. MMG005 TaxID=2822682 RepID=UPI001B39F9FF|nr:S8 family serine peptidase [Pseudoalteromonas sp. MMG005]MBQ4844606.1 S8 family serine peptidase [Pseudoalteromonas sp. MMG005]